MELLLNRRSIVGDRSGNSLNLLKQEKGDVLVVCKLDRLAKSLSFLISLIEDLRERCADYHSLSDGIDLTTAGGQLVFHVMGALAEFERALIVDRAKAGMEAAKQRGKHLGRPRMLTQPNRSCVPSDRERVGIHLRDGCDLWMQPINSLARVERRAIAFKEHSQTLTPPYGVTQDD